MPRADYKRCKDCGRHTSEVGPLSHTRLCNECGIRRIAANGLQIASNVGPYAERRRYGYAVKLFGPRVAVALRQAGVIGPEIVDAERLAT